MVRKLLLGLIFCVLFLVSLQGAEAWVCSAESSVLGYCFERPNGGSWTWTNDVGQISAACSGPPGCGSVYTDNQCDPLSRIGCWSSTRMSMDGSEVSSNNCNSYFVPSPWYGGSDTPCRYRLSRSGEPCVFRTDCENTFECVSGSCARRPYYMDNDGDGYRSVSSSGNCGGTACPGGSSFTPGTDCNDGNPGINPAQPDICGNGVAEDCVADLACSVNYYRDGDNDKFGTGATRTTPGAGWYQIAHFSTGSTGGDCNDANPGINPAQPDICGNGVAENCVSDQPCASTWYLDVDADDYSDGTARVQVARPTNHYLSGELTQTWGDCDDGNPGINPGESDICGNGVAENCVSDQPCATTWYRDVDGDGYHRLPTTSSVSDPGAQWYPTTSGVDCNDGNPSIFVNRNVWTDVDGDTWTVGGSSTQCWDNSATPPANKALSQRSTDCDDGVYSLPNTCGPDPTWYFDFDDDNYHSSQVTQAADPGPGWSTSTLGNDCNDGVDTVWELRTTYDDADGDTWTDGSNPNQCVGASAPAGTTFSSRPTDCDDSTFSAANSCGPDPTWYRDVDGDGFHRSTQTSASDPGAQWYPTTSGLDCDDNDYDLSNSCGPDPTWYRDVDGDGYHRLPTQVSASDPGAQWYPTTSGVDCDDNVFSATNNCASTWYRDVDGDGFHRLPTQSSVSDPGAQWYPTTSGVDCDDNNYNILNSCATITYYEDSDSDGQYDDSPSGTCQGTGCQPGGSSLSPGNDCSDGNPNVYLGQTEICNGIDDNCVGGVDEGGIGPTWYADIDGDSYSSGLTQQACSGNQPANYYSAGSLTSTSGDCDDGNPAVNPGETEICNGIDDNCIGGVDEGLIAPAAAEQDGECAGSIQICTGLGGWRQPNNAELVSQGNGRGDVVELPSETSCDNLDNDCDGAIDEGLKTDFYSDYDSDGWLNETANPQCVRPPGPWFLPGETSEPTPPANTYWDKDDSDWWETYVDCSPFEVFVVEKNNIYAPSGPAHPNDWSYDNSIKPVEDNYGGEYYTNKFRGECVPSSGLFCTFNGNLYAQDGITIPRGATHDGSPANDINMYCSTNCGPHGCEWLDYDSDSTTCETTYNWLVNGTTGLGEYETTESECCGDDSNERPSVRECLSSTTSGAVCCPNDGQDWFNLDGECVTSCPDLMNSMETFIPLNPGQLYDGYEAALSSTPSGYCCDGTLDASKPLCQAGETGCFISSGIPGTQDLTQGRKFWCQETPGDDYCMVETCLEGNTYSACEVFNSCHDTVKVLGYGNADKKDICENYGTISTPLDNSNYYTIDASCAPAQITNCEAVTREECTGVGDCDVVCQVDASGNRYGCAEVCSNYNCQTITSYHGGECQIDAACNPVNQSDSLETIDESSLNGCTTLGVCNQFGCAASACNEYGCPASLEIYHLETLCSEEFYCSDLSCVNGANSIVEPDLHCFLEEVPNGNPFVLNITESGPNVLTNTYFQCNPTALFEEGDPWCEYAQSSDPIAYEPLPNRCESAAPDVCDYSAVSGGEVQSNTVNGCDDITGTGTDYWGQYNDNCAYDTSSPIPNVYDAACCVAYSIDNFDVYDRDLVSDNMQNGIRIY